MSTTSAFSSQPIAATAGASNLCIDLKLAPFHLLATEGCVHTDKDHLWHIETLGRGSLRLTRNSCGPRRFWSST